MHLRLALPLLTLLSLAPLISADPTTSEWNGHRRIDFEIGGAKALLVLPDAPAEGKPWIWRMRFFGHEPQADLALINEGFHLAYIDIANLFGAPVALDRMDAFYDHLREVHSLSSKPVLEGFSRGGLPAFNWAARHPDRVTCLYVDAPVCDFKSWPLGRGDGPGSAGAWVQCLEAYGLSEAEALAYPLNPVDNLKPLAEAKIPILAICGGADEVVPLAENAGLVKERYEALGGAIELIVKPGGAHHPHSLEDPKPIVDFVLSHVGN